MSKITLIIVVTLIIFPAFANDKVKYVIGDKRLEVPSSIIVDMSLWQWIKSQAGLDDDVEGFIFELESEVIKSFAPNYKILENAKKSNVVGSVSDFSSESKSNFWDSKEYHSLWYAKEDYYDREIIKHEPSKQYLVFSSIGYRGKFYVFSVYPNVDEEIPKNKWEFLVAICSGASLSELKNVTCNRQLLLKENLLVSYSFSFENLIVQPVLDKFIKQQVSSW